MTFTVSQLMQIFLALCGGIITIGGAATIIIKLITKARKPDKDRDNLVKKHQEMLDNDNKRLKALEEGNKVVMQALLAMMSHELDGNHTEQLKHAHDSIKEYLINR
ncbi:hypothetical protein SAMN05660484_00032 [Eubacterium ruminantium]|uniref:hypothetical protein n=1 Tax=Eubacterium ruminantium TaxID=42322 RepID=UPI0008713446|nr:hypothetical protein [Eubacterium ruminantium]SCW26640.1 hypothetical protein SAMN05660484_00032 [Eubacterium ruminantium]SDM16836.1 hypothetical protein SAMN04490370_101257 [Eubacterium ruminantium]